MIDVTTSDGKYRYVQQADGKVTVYRNGEEWFTSGMEQNNMLRAFAFDLAKYKELAKDLTDQLEIYKADL